MATIVTVNSHDGVLSRYVLGRQRWRLTHSALAPNAPVIFTAKVVEDFRLMPDPHFSVEPPPRPTNPPAAAGRVAIAA